MALGIDGQAGVLLLHGAKERVNLGERIHFVAKQLNAVGIVIVCGIDLDHVSTHPECAALEIGVIAFVEDFHQLAEDVIAADLLSFFQEEQHAVISFRRSQAVDAAH